MFKLTADGAAGAGDGKGFLDLAEDLRLTDDHGIKAGGNAEEMADGLLVVMLIDMRREQRRVEAEVAMQESSEVSLRRLDGSEQLHAVAGGDDHALSHAGDGGEGARGFRQLVAGDGDALTQLNGSRFVVDANDGEGHWAPNLCTWLMKLAAQTPIITTSTAPET